MENMGGSFWFHNPFFHSILIFKTNVTKRLTQKESIIFRQLAVEYEKDSYVEKLPIEPSPAYTGKWCY